MLDPLLQQILSLGLSLLFFTAAWHKLGGLQQFRFALGDYQLLPRSMLGPVALLIPATECLLGIAWLLSIRPLATAVVSAGLLAIYAAAIAINLIRGRVHIGCGCGAAGTAGGDQPLSAWLLVRNSILIVAALLCGLPSHARDLGTIDYLTLIAGVVVVVLLYGAATQLLANLSAIRVWRVRA
jgi:hypothetical protein|tara:strand:- start:5419 stop:5967 length:549 start_codon:yes stop_codon:yes gene_type:complete